MMSKKDFEMMGTTECVNEANQLGLQDPETRSYFKENPVTRHDIYYLCQKGVLHADQVKRGRIKQYLFIKRDAKLIYLVRKYLNTGEYTIEGALNQAEKELGIPSREQVVEDVQQELKKDNISFADGSIPITPKTAEYLLQKIRKK